ncbi:MAG: ABC transporter ATP-binding protein [Candidatus Atribacteria bacterium]|nr:ABC transporter ATP-binding protein [Candidatus Atribacteria bacterium]
MKPVIEVRNLSKTYFMDSIEVRALQNVSFQIYPDEFVAVMGPSGSGKSSLLNILGCLDIPTSGQYLLNGQEVSQLNENQLASVRNQKIGFVFQSFNLLPKLNAFQNVELPLLYAGISRSMRHEIVDSLLESVGLTERKFHRPNQLSGGQTQRVAIARALVNSPSILLTDEPTGNLDTRSGEEVMQIFQNLNDQGKTILLITHENDISLHAQRILRFRDGRLEGDEKVEKPLKAYDLLLQPVVNEPREVSQTP